MFKKTPIIFVICFAILFKLSFFNITFFTFKGSSLTELINKHEIFKAGKKRRRTPDHSSQYNQPFVNEDQLIAEYEETEDKKEFLNILKFPLLTCFFFSGFVLKRIQSLFSLRGISGDFPLSIPKHLSISILRI